MPNEIKPIREALRGHWDNETLGDYSKEALKGAGFGAAAGLAAAPFTAGWSAAALPAEAAVGALGWAGMRGVDDLFYKFYSNEKKIAWLAGDLEDIIEKELVPAIKDTNPQMSEAMMVFARDYKNYIDHYIRDHKTDLMQNNAIVATINTSQENMQPQVPQPQANPNQTLQEFMQNGQELARNSSVKKTKFIKVAVNPIGLLKGVGSLGTGLVGEYGVGKAYDYGANLLRGNQQISSAIKRSKQILEEIDKISAGLPQDLLAYLRAGSNILYNQIINIEKNYRQEQMPFKNNYLK